MTLSRPTTREYIRVRTDDRRNGRLWHTTEPGSMVPPCKVRMDHVEHVRVSIEWPFPKCFKCWAEVNRVD